MVIEVIDEADRGERYYYMIPKRVGEVLTKAWGTEIYDPSYRMGEQLYESFMSLCKPLGEVEVCTPDIIFHTC